MTGEEKKFLELERINMAREKALKKKIGKTYQDTLEKIVQELRILSQKEELTRTELYRFKRNEKLEKAINGELKAIKDIQKKGIARYGVETYDLNYFYSGYIMETEYQEKLAYQFINRQKVIASIENPLTQISIKNNRDNVIVGINRAITQGVIRGQTLTQISRGVKQALETNANNAFRIVQTETTRISQIAEQDSFVHAKNRGLNIKKEWVASLDDRTRPAHQFADGQIVDIEKPFDVDGEDLMQPGDPAGSAENVINCRCRMITVIVGYENAYQYRKARNVDGKNKIIPYKTFESWAKNRVSK